MDMKLELTPFDPRDKDEDTDEDTEEEEEEEEEDVIQFLLISHGGTISASRVYYKTITKISQFNFYCPAKHYLSVIQYPLTLNNLEHVAEKINSTPTIDPNYNEVFLPPLVFNGESGTNMQQKEIMGIYTKSSPSSPEYDVKIADNNMLLANSVLIPGSENVTYSVIERLMYKYIKETYPERTFRVKLNLFCCRGQIGRYETVETIPKDTIFVSGRIRPVGEIPITYSEEPRAHTSQSNDNMELLCMRKIEDDIIAMTTSWTGPLGKIIYQGCGINVLRMLNILATDEDAVHRAIILYKTGTSIYKIMDYINTFMGNPSLILSAYSFTLDEGLRYIDVYTSKFVYSPHPTGTIFTTIVKLYRSHDIDNESGHFVIIYKKSGVLYVIDPQAMHLNIVATEYFAHFTDFVRIGLIHSNDLNEHPMGYLCRFLRITPTYLDRGRTRLLWGGRGEKSTKVTEISKSELDNINMIKDVLITRWMIDVYSEDEFALTFTKQESNKLMTIKTPYKFTSAVKCCAKLKKISKSDKSFFMKPFILKKHKKLSTPKLSSSYRKSVTHKLYSLHKTPLNLKLSASKRSLKSNRSTHKKRITP